MSVPWQVEFRNRGNRALLYFQPVPWRENYTRAGSFYRSQRERKKHVRWPVWQAGPRGSTRTSSVSPSQSISIETTRCVLPEVSPLCQSVLRERLQNHVSPVSMVLANDSAFM